MSLDLINPFEEVVIVGKRYRIAVPPQSSQVISARTPTGRHVSHANALKVVHNSKGGGGKATRLERYTPRKGGKLGVGHRKATLLKVGKAAGLYPFEKGFGDDPDHPTFKAPAGSFSSDDAPLKTGAKFLTKKKVGIGAGVVAGGLATTGIIRSKKKSDNQVPQLVGASKGLTGAALPKPTGTPRPTPGNLLSGLGGAKGPTTPQAPKPPKVPVSALNSNMPAAATTGRRLP